MCSNYTRFIPGPEGCLNIQKSSNVIYHLNILKNKNHMILSIDSEENIWQTLTPILNKKFL